MKLEDFLKVKKVRCVDVGGLCLSKDKEYQLLGVTDKSCIINDDDGYEIFASIERFETVLDDLSKTDNKISISENSVNDTDSVIPTFKVGDKVYCPSMLNGIIYTVKRNSKYPREGCKLFVINDHEDCYDFDECGSNQYNNPIVYHATEENHQALRVLHPDIEFEAPPKELKGSDLCCAMLRSNHRNIMCQVDGDETNIRIITLYTGSYFYDRSGNRYSEVVPIDTKGVPLTEDVLNETINE